MSHSDLRKQAVRSSERKMREIADDVSGSKVKKAIKEHESHDHKGQKPTRVKFADGGNVEGQGAKTRLDRQGKKGGRKQAHTNVNVIVAPGQGADKPMPVPVPGGGGGAPPGGAGAPPPAPPHPMMPPGGGAPMGPPGAMPRPPMGGAPMGGAGGPMPMRARGGRAYPIDDGSKSGPGRLEKTKAAAKQGDFEENEAVTRASGGRTKLEKDVELESGDPLKNGGKVC